MRRRPLRSAVRRLAAAAAVFAAGWLACGGDARAQRTADGQSLLGEWTGTYLCHNRKGLARATLSEAAGRGYRGTLSFIPSGEADGRTGRIEILARTGPDGLVDLAPRRWIVLLPGHNLLRFRGRLSPDGQSIRGAVLSPDCVDFALSFARPLEPARGTRPAEPDPKPAPTPPPPLVPKGRLDYAPEIDCAAIAERGERDDCVVAERYRPRFGTGIAGPNLAETCRTAFRDLDPIATPECLTGVFAINRRPTRAQDVIRDAPSCQEFKVRARRIIMGQFKLETATTWTRGRTDHNACANLEAMRSARGLPVLTTCRRKYADFHAELAECSGENVGSDAFRALWVGAVRDCAEGRRIGLFAQIKQIREGANIWDLFDMGCEDVFAVAVRAGAAYPGAVDQARRELAALAGGRPPRDDEIIAALKADMARRYACRDGRSYKTPDKMFSCSYAPRGPDDANAERVIDGVNDAVGSGDAMNPSFRNGPTVDLALRGVDLVSCQPAGGGAQACAVRVAIGCKVKGMVGAPGLDIDGALIGQSVCPALVGPAERTLLLRWDGARFVIAPNP